MATWHRQKFDHFLQINLCQIKIPQSLALREVKGHFSYTVFKKPIN